VIAHAVTDALLGAAGLGDIGQHFPDTDERWRDADSIELLRERRARELRLERPAEAPQRGRGDHQHEREALDHDAERVARHRIAEDQDPAAFREALLETRGLGPWSAEYIRLRNGDTDAFPNTDLILKRVLDLHSELDLERIKPWGSYAAVYLWKEFAQTLSKAKGENKHDVIL
jgi:hypothetical protein